MNVGIICGCNGWFWVGLYNLIQENSCGGETVGSMTYRSPFGLFFSSSFLGSMVVEVNFSTTGHFFCFLDTLGLSSTVHFIPKILLLNPSLVKSCFKSMIPEQFQISPLCGGYNVTEPYDVIEVGEFDKGFKVDGG